ncbi:MAG: acyltransferase [Flavobacteriia bacterium]|nr:acyltransferase [Flavobacteriia bacterium]
MSYIKGFNGLRSYSILLVIVTHLGIAHSLESGSYMKERVFYFFSGPAGVNIFFALSGFLITHLILKEIQRYGHFNIKNFFARRFIRLLPPIIPFYLALFIFMQLGYVRETYLGLLASVFYLYNFVPKAKILWSTELSHTWSLAVEEQFYLIWAFFYRFLSRKQIMIWIIILLLACIAANYIWPIIPVTIKGETYTLDQIAFIKRWIIPAMGPILLGALFAILNHYHFDKVKARFSSQLSLVLGFLVLCSPFYIPGFLLPLKAMTHALGAVFILVWVYHNQESKFVRILEWGPLRYIGVISYSLYIWQGFFVRTSSTITPKIWVHDFPFNVVLTFVVAILSYELYEKHVLKLKKRFSAGK